MDAEDVAPDVVVGPAEEFARWPADEAELCEAMAHAITEANACGLPVDYAELIRMIGRRRRRFGV